MTTTLQEPPKGRAAPPQTPARKRLLALMAELDYDRETIEAIADAQHPNPPPPPWDDRFLLSICSAIDLLRDAKRTAGQVKTRVAGFKQAAAEAGPDNAIDWRNEFWRAEIAAAIAAEHAATAEAEAYSPPPPC